MRCKGIGERDISEYSKGYFPRKENEDFGLSMVNESKKEGEQSLRKENLER